MHDEQQWSNTNQQQNQQPRYPQREGPPEVYVLLFSHHTENPFVCRSNSRWAALKEPIPERGPVMGGGGTWTEQLPRDERLES